MINNPYITGTQIKDKSMFFGREKELSLISAKLDNISQSGIVVLYGDRRCGKTTILYQIKSNIIGKEYQSIIADMQAFAVSSDIEFWERMFSLLKGVSPDNSISAENIDKNRLYISVEKAIEKLLSSISPLPLIILVDEYELIEKKILSGALSNEILPFIASLIDRVNGLWLVFTGSRNLDQRHLDEWKYLLGKSSGEQISNLSYEDTHNLITIPVKEQLQVPEKSIELIFSLTYGQPFYTQLICQKCINIMNNDDIDEFDEDLIDEAVEEIISNPLPQIEYFYNNLPDEERNIIDILAEELDNAEDFIEIKVLADKMLKGKGVPDKKTIRALRNLESHNLVSMKEGSKVHLCMDILRRWITWNR